MPPEIPIGTPFFELSEVDSTNNYAMRQIQVQMSGHGSTWFAHYQNSGKGQRGKPWKAAAGENIIMSVVTEPIFISIDNQFILAVAVALACHDFFCCYALSNTSIKWPNDLYWRDRKAGGILIENVLQGKDWKYAIIGMGININQTSFPPELLNPVSLKQITGETFDTIALAKNLCNFLQGRWQQLKEERYEQLLEEYNHHLYKFGEIVTLKKNNVCFDAQVKGVNNQGELLINSAQGPFAVAHGNIEWMIS